MYRWYHRCLLLILVAVLLGGCSIQSAVPKAGLYYCEELHITIDFSVCAKPDPDCAILHQEDGSGTAIRFYVYYGNDMSFNDPESKCEFFNGAFHWDQKNDIFRVKERKTGQVYYFYPVDLTGG